MAYLHKSTDENRTLPWEPIYGSLGRKGYRRAYCLHWSTGDTRTRSIGATRFLCTLAIGRAYRRHPLQCGVPLSSAVAAPRVADLQLASKPLIKHSNGRAPKASSGLIGRAPTGLAGKGRAVAKQSQHARPAYGASSAGRGYAMTRSQWMIKLVVASGGARWT